MLQHCKIKVANCASLRHWEHGEGTTKRCKTLPDKKQGSDERVADFAMALKKSFKLEDYFPNEEAMPAVLYLTKNVLNEVAPF